MTDRELSKAEEILRKNHINASPIAFWEMEKYYKITYMTYNGNCYAKTFNK